MSTLIIDDIAATAVKLHNHYIELRDPPVPFPPESVAFWCVLLAMQSEMSIEGDLLELGVEHGGTAFLSILALRDSEQQVLLDLQKSERFENTFKLLSDDVSQRVKFIENSTQNVEATKSLVERRWRYIHIDAGHSYNAVKSDMERYAGLLTDEGILCCDDFFLNRWPEVTIAILDTYEKAGVQPIALVNRKIYFAKAKFAMQVKDMVKQASVALQHFGRLNHWLVTLRGVDVDFYQINPTSVVSNDVMKLDA